jgi:hypothetical protein
MVFADHLSGAEANYAMDASEAASSTSTDGAGRFTITEPGYGYMIVSTGGTDTITGLPAMHMLAPAGARNLSPLTTLVALDPDSRSVIESLGIQYDDDLTVNITPAAAIVVQCVQTAVDVLTNAINNGNAFPYTVVNNVQREIMTGIAHQLKSSNTASLTDPASLASTLGTAVGSALTSTTVTSLVTIGDAATITDAITLAVTNMADNMVVSFGTGTTGPVAEDTLVTPAIALFNTTETFAASDTANINGGIVVLPFTNTAPTIGGDPLLTVAAGTAFQFTPTASDPEGDILLFDVQNLPSWAVFNKATGALTGTPTNGDIGLWPDIQISVSDGMHMQWLADFSITVIAPTGSSGI